MQPGRLVNEFYTALRMGQWEDLAGLCTPSITYSRKGYPAVHGPAALEQVFRNRFASGSYRWGIEQILMDSRGVVQAQAELQTGIKWSIATQTAVIRHVFRVRSGLIADIEERVVTGPLDSPLPDRKTRQINSSSISSPRIQPPQLPIIRVLANPPRTIDRRLRDAADHFKRDLLNHLSMGRWCHAISADAPAAAEAQYILLVDVRCALGDCKFTVSVGPTTTGDRLWEEEFTMQLSSHTNWESWLARSARAVHLAVTRFESDPAFEGRARSPWGCGSGWHYLNLPVNRRNNERALAAFAALPEEHRQTRLSVLGRNFALARQSINVWHDPLSIPPDVMRAEVDGVLGEDAGDALAYFVRGLLHRAAGRPDASLKDCERAIRHDPSLAPANAQIGQNFMRLGDVQRTFAPVQSALVLAPHDPNRSIWWFILGSASAYAEDYQRAKVVLSQAIAADPEYPHAWAILAASLEADGETDRAHQALNRLRKVAPDYAIETFRAFGSGGSYAFGRQVDRICSLLHDAGLREDWH